MNDLMTIIVSLAGFALFFALHVFVFRRIREQEAVRWFFLLVVGISLVLAAYSWVSSIVFILLSCCYFMGIFGLMATSVRIRILSEIARTGSRGMTYKELLTRYNRKEIVGGRLARLVSSGDIVYAGGKYRVKGRVTFFVFPAMVLRAMKVLYG